MRPETAPAIRLADYRVPDYLVETVDLDVRLMAHETRVRARTAYTPNPEGVRRRTARCSTATSSPSSRIALDGRPLEPAEYVLSDASLTLASPPARRFMLDIETKLDPSANTKLLGLYRSTRPIARNARRKAFAASPISSTGPTCSPSTRRASRPSARKRRSCSPTATSVEARRGRGHGPAFRRLARSLPEALLSLRAGRRRSRLRREDASRTLSGREVELGIYVEPGKEDRAGLRARRAEALDALGRGGVRPRIRSRRLQHRRRVRFQHGRDGEQGPQHLQRQIRAGDARDRDRCRLRRISRRHRARIFPQLDRQPDHLPRLVPALPEGRPDGLPRPGILLRHALARRSSASPMCARLRARQFPEDAGPPRPSGAARQSITRSTISTRRPSTRKAPRSSAC